MSSTPVCELPWVSIGWCILCKERVVLLWHSSNSELLVKPPCPLNSVEMPTANTCLSDTHFPRFLGQANITPFHTPLMNKFFKYNIFILSQPSPADLTATWSLSRFAFSVLITIYLLHGFILKSIFISLIFKFQGDSSLYLQELTTLFYQMYVISSKWWFMLVLPIWPGIIFVLFDKNTDLLGGLFEIESIKWAIFMISVLQFWKDRIIFENCLG